MLQALTPWNEPANFSHWNIHLDAERTRFSEMLGLGLAAIRKISPQISIVLGDISACDGDFLALIGSDGVNCANRLA